MGPLEPKIVVKGENSYCPLTINKEVSYELKPPLLKMELQLTNTYRKLLIKMVLLIVHSEERKLLKNFSTYMGSS